jgi:hypothetical protein
VVTRSNRPEASIQRSLPGQVTVPAAQPRDALAALLKPPAQVRAQEARRTRHEYLRADSAILTVVLATSGGTFKSNLSLGTPTTLAILARHAQEQRSLKTIRPRRRKIEHG